MMSRIPKTALLGALSLTLTACIETGRLPEDGDISIAVDSDLPDDTALPPHNDADTSDGPDLSEDTSDTGEGDTADTGEGDTTDTGEGDTSIIGDTRLDPDAGQEVDGSDSFEATPCTQHNQCLAFCHEGWCVDPEGDLDNDGLSNLVEFMLGSNPLDADTDHDGKPDGEEFGDGTAARDSDGDNVPDLLESSLIDSDGDCLSNEIDPRNQLPDELSLVQELRLHECSHLGVCALGPIAVTCDLGVFGCNYDAVPGFVAEGDCESKEDLNCDGEPDHKGSHCIDEDLDEVLDSRDNCVGVYNPGQEDLDGDGQGDACDTPDLVSPLVLPISGLVSPGEVFELSGLAQPHHTVYLYRSADCSDEANETVEASAEGAFGFLTSEEEGRTTFAVRVKNHVTFSACQVLASEVLVTPHRYIELGFNAARLQSWDGHAGITRLSFLPFSRNAVESHVEWQTPESYTLYVGSDASCQTNPAYALTPHENPSFERLYADIAITQAEPNLYGYLQDSHGVRSECTPLGLSFGAMQLRTTVEAPFQRAMREGMSDPGRAWVVGPSGTLSSHTLPALNSSTLSLPLGAALVVEGLRSSDARGFGLYPEEALTYVFWDLKPGVSVKVEDALLYNFDFRRVGTISDHARYWTWGPCGVHSGYGSYLLAISSTLNLACLPYPYPSFAISAFHTAQPGLGEPAQQRLDSTYLPSYTSLLEEGSWESLVTTWSNPAGLSDFKVLAQGLEGTGFKALLWPQGPWFSGAAFSALTSTEAGDESLQSTFPGLAHPLQSQGVVAVQSLPFEQQRQLYARQNTEATSTTLHFGPTQPDRLPAHVDALAVLYPAGQTPTAFVPNQLTLSEEAWLSEHPYGLEHPVRGHLKVTEVKSRFFSSSTLLTISKLEHTWSLDFNGWPQWSLPVARVSSVRTWENATIELDFLGFMESTPWSWVLGARRLNADSETFITTHGGVGRDRLQMVRWTSW